MQKLDEDPQRVKALLEDAKDPLNTAAIGGHGNCE